MGLSFHEMQAAAQEMSLRAVFDEDLSNYTLCDDGRYEVYTEYADDAVSEVDKHKNITVNEEQCNLTQEENSQYVPFKLPRYWDGVDLMTKLIQFHYVNINGGSGISTAVNVRFNDSYIICGWLINKSVTAVAGDVTFEITATGTNEKLADYRWRTRPNGKFTVLEALSYDGIIEPSDDWYAGFVKSMQEYTTKAAESAKSARDYADQSKSNLDQVTQITETFATNAQEVKETAINEINNAKASGVNAVEAAAAEIVNDREKITENANNISSLKSDLDNVEDIVGKQINGIFNGNDYISSLVLEAGTTYHILYGSGSAANLYIQGDTSTFVSVDEGGLYEFTPKITGIIQLFRDTVDSKNDIVFYIGTHLTFFRDIRKNAHDIENGFASIQTEVNETKGRLGAVETDVNSIFVEKKITQTNDRAVITQFVAKGYYLGISPKVPKGTRVEKIAFGVELTKGPYIVFVDTNGSVIKKWAITSKVMYIDYTAEADGVFVYHTIGDISNFKWESATDGSKNTLIPQYVHSREAEINVGDTLEKPYLNNTTKVWADCEISIIELNYEIFNDNKYRGKKIAFLGDSITAGLTWNGSEQIYVKKPYPITVAEKLNCECQNVGHSSFPISSIGKAQCFNTTYSEIALDTDYIFVFGGTNDYQYSVPVGTIADREDVSFCGAVFTLINKIRTRNPNAKLVFFTPLHRSSEVKSDGFKLIDYVNAIRDVCELCAIPVVDLYKNSGFSNVVTEMQQYYADGLHLTQDGYNVLGDVIAERIRYV